MWKVGGTKIERTRARYIFFPSGHGNLRKSDFLVKRSIPENFQRQVWEINVRQIIIIANGINSQTPKLQTALARVLDELERNQKKGKSSTYNFQDDGHISSCPVVHV